MKSPLLAALAAVAFLFASPMVGRVLAETVDVANITAPLACAMAHSGPCNVYATFKPMEASAG